MSQLLPWNSINPEQMSNNKSICIDETQFVEMKQKRGKFKENKRHEIIYILFLFNSFVSWFTALNIIIALILSNMR